MKGVEKVTQTAPGILSVCLSIYLSWVYDKNEFWVLILKELLKFLVMLHSVEPSGHTFLPLMLSLDIEESEGSQTRH